ncbi:hypothetical protein LDHU3_28.2220:CDS1 [Leishmania donovani]|uniref:Hypothetical_protein n=2 Tax=Leishmania donovani species complex TaxID=38574 RepID=A0A6L0XK46_LEIIN|nr:hypothetical protein LdCL_280021900 [Leishmania donovani]CAC9503686.1 hypothetical_protein [Leishmania infantum]TPP54301.1 hypothetical protein CGC21_22300 [Leishmania donovani]CAJ1990312.1 hypothetical protein LDHU3_28.2220:CDS1 [Leishmania donovani]SUZ43332.1 hypothetical_protein [Leishmania infantum]
MEPTQPQSSADSRASEEQPQWLFPDADPSAVSAQPFVCDPYGGVPRREDYDPCNTAQPPPPRTHDHDMQATFRSFRGVVLSTQSWGVQWTEATDTSVKRWVQRALKVDDVEDPSSSSPWAPSSPRAASSGRPSNDDSACEYRECSPRGATTTAPPQRDSQTLQRRQHPHPARGKGA